MSENSARTCESTAASVGEACVEVEAWNNNTLISIFYLKSYYETKRLYYDTILWMCVFCVAFVFYIGLKTIFLI